MIEHEHSKAYRKLVCPLCKNKFAEVLDTNLKCNVCNKNYRIEDGIPILDVMENIPKNKRWENGQASESAKSFGKEISEETYVSSGFDLYETHSLLMEQKVTNIRGTNKINGALEIGPVSCPRIAYVDQNSEKFAIDIAMKDYYQYFKDLYKKHNIIPINGYAENLPFPDSSLDLVVASNSLDHCLHPFSVLKEARRVLRKGGMFFISNNMFSFLWRTLADLNLIDRSHPYHYSKKSIIRMIDSSGLFVYEAHYNLPIVQTHFWRKTNLKSKIALRLGFYNSIWIFAMKLN